nr:response regulator transcription factor [Streptomyces sp. SID11385]
MILAEDSALLREGLVRLLAEEGHEVVAALGDAEAVPAAVAAYRPELVVLDVRMPPTHTDEGLRAAVALRAAHPALGVVVLSQYVERTSAARLLADGVERVGYLLKDRIGEVGEFLDALERVRAGGTVIDPEVVRRLFARTGRADPLARLTPRERTVLEALAQGHTNAALAERLHLSLSAVEKHLNSVFQKLGLPDSPAHNRRVLAVLRYLEG